MTSIGADGTIRNAWRPGEPWVPDAMRTAAMDDLRLVYDSSNYVYLARLVHPEHGDGLGIYKPRRGERPLYDFPSATLYRREIAAYEFSRLLGWDLIPPTVEAEGPQGVGSLQLFVEHNPAEHYFELRDRDVHDEQFVRFAAFDLMANNADRKGGHLLLDPHGHVWGIDNGLCFHEQHKVRTVIWDYSGSELPDPWMEDIRRVIECVPADDEAETLRRCLDGDELAALIARCRELLARPVLPEMYPYRCVPWPLI